MEELERLGRRIADLRAKAGWTQQQLAERVAVSRVAISHVEAGMSQPGERTVALMAGVFRLEPLELVAGTDYPQAKAERLPLSVARYTETELQVALCESDLSWIERDDTASGDQVLAAWEVRLRHLATDAPPSERELVDDLATRVRRLVDQRISEINNT